MKRIVLAANPARFMRWHERLRERLAKKWPDAEVVFRLDALADDQPAVIAHLLALERLLLLRGRPALCDRLPPPPRTIDADGSKADVVVVLTGAAVPPPALRVLRPLYDGKETDQAAIGAILSGSAPFLAVEDAATGEIVAQGLPAMECDPAVTSGLDAVYSRIAQLIEQAIAAPRPLAPPARIEPRHVSPYGYLLETLAHRAIRAIYNICCHAPHWRCGWRFNDGPGVLDTGTLDGPAWTPFYSSDLGFAADPFPVEWRGRAGVFFESMDYRSGKGHIAFQAFDDKGTTGAPIPCLEEPWHLSYPFLVAQGDELFMLPEASLSGAVTLYRCRRFPDRWEPAAKLLENIEAADATIFRHDGRYWMTSVVRDGYEGFGGYSDTLALHYAPTLFGPWRPHGLFPALVDSRYARPAGAVATHNGALLRPAQECSRGYGKGLSLMRIDRLDPETFEQSLVATIHPKEMWPGSRLHTINRLGRLEFIDGAILAPKSLPLRRIFANMIDARPGAPSDWRLPLSSAGKRRAPGGPLPPEVPPVGTRRTWRT